MDNIAMSDQQLSNERRQDEEFDQEESTSLCIECGVCATILCFSTFMGIVAFIVLAVIAYYLGDSKNYVPYSIIFISMFIGSVMCKLYTRYQIKAIQETERIHRLNTVEETLGYANQLKGIHPINDCRNSLHSLSVPKIEITDTESVNDEFVMIEDYPTVVHHGDTVEYVFGPLPTKRFIERRNASKNASYTFDMEELDLEQQFHKTDAITPRDSFNFEGHTEGIQTLSVRPKSHVQPSSLKFCTDSLSSENVWKKSITEDGSVEKNCITEDDPMVIPNRDGVNYALDPTATEKSSEKLQESSKCPNTSVLQEHITRSYTQFHPYDPLSVTHSLNSGGECNKTETSQSIQSQKQHIYPSIVAPCTDALYSDDVSKGEVFYNKLVTTEYSKVVFPAEPVEQVFSSLPIEKCSSVQQECKNELNIHSSQEIITQQFYQNDALLYRDSLVIGEESYSGYETDENMLEENEDYPVVRHHGEIVEYIFGPLPARMLEERRKIMHTERDNDVSRM